MFTCFMGKFFLCVFLVHLLLMHISFLLFLSVFSHRFYVSFLSILLYFGLILLQHLFKYTVAFPIYFCFSFFVVCRWFQRKTASMMFLFCYLKAGSPLTFIFWGYFWFLLSFIDSELPGKAFRNLCWSTGPCHCKY